MKVVKDLDGIHAGGVNINIFYADDTTPIADSEVKLQNLVNALFVEIGHKVFPLTSSIQRAWLFQKRRLLHPVIPQ